MNYRSYLLRTETVLDAMPEGWRRVEGHATAPRGFAWICTGRLSDLSYRHALISLENLQKSLAS